jgi:hypothetical protein
MALFGVVFLCLAGAFAANHFAVGLMTMVVFPLSTSSGAGIFCPLKLISYDSVVCSCVMLAL